VGIPKFYFGERTHTVPCFPLHPANVLAHCPGAARDRVNRASPLRGSALCPLTARVTASAPGEYSRQSATYCLITERLPFGQPIGYLVGDWGTYCAQLSAAKAAVPPAVPLRRVELATSWQVRCTSTHPHASPSPLLSPTGRCVARLLTLTLTLALTLTPSTLILALSPQLTLSPQPSLSLSLYW
jgi:hypothetical protein